MSKQNLLNFSFDELKTFCLNNDLPRFRATQIWRWMYCFGLQSFMEMNNVSKSTRVFLNELSLLDGTAALLEYRSLLEFENIILGIDKFLKSDSFFIFVIAV